MSEDVEGRRFTSNLSDSISLRRWPIRANFSKQKVMPIRVDMNMLNQVSVVDESCLHDFESHIDGKNASVRVYPDRVEWDRSGKVSKGKALLGVATAGMSIAATGIRSGLGSSEMIPMKALTSVTSERDGMRHMKVRLIASGNTIEMRVDKGEADAVKNTLTRLMIGTHPSQQAVVARTEPPEPTPVAMDADDPTASLKKLAELRDEGLISEDQFESKRQQILDRL